MSEATKKFDTLDKVKKRQDILVGGRLRDQDRIRAASEKMDVIRKRLSEKLAASDSTEIIRKFRDAR
ncbi:MAG: hypothetical protein HZC51_12420 [Nitrospirae bacterium]|nr:hypothetical protein [Nitrospirota bacterium]